MRILTCLLMVAGLLLSGCSGGSPSEDPVDLGNDQVLDVTENTGGIRGVVVDQAIKPLAGAQVSLPTGKNMTTGEDGQFSFTGLTPGDYFLSVAKPGFRGAQVSTTVVAGVAEPAVVRVLLESLATAQPYSETYRLDGFYECAFAITGVITDGCDFAYRTAWDGYNETQGSPPPAAPRTIQKFRNTQYINVSLDTWTIISEAFWNNDQVPNMMVSVAETPIDNLCDCSPDYFQEVGPTPLLLRGDMLQDDGSVDEPAGMDVAIRGFLPFETSVALNFQFTILTTLFHNYVAPDGWTFETREQFPDP